MKVLLLQTDIRWQSPGINRQRAQHVIETAPQADLVVLPEMFTTGFCTDPQGVAEPAETETLEWMRDMAFRFNAAIAGSVAVEENGSFFNRFYFVRPDGNYTL